MKIKLKFIAIITAVAIGGQAECMFRRACLRFTRPNYSQKIFLNPMANRLVNFAGNQKLSSRLAPFNLHLINKLPATSFSSLRETNLAALEKEYVKFRNVNEALQSFKTSATVETLKWQFESFQLVDNFRWHHWEIKNFRNVLYTLTKEQEDLLNQCHAMKQKVYFYQARETFAGDYGERIANPPFRVLSNEAEKEYNKLRDKLARADKNKIAKDDVDQRLYQGEVDVILSLLHSLEGRLKKK
jgi:hypothetical protein